MRAKERRKEREREKRRKKKTREKEERKSVKHPAFFSASGRSNPSRIFVPVSVNQSYVFI